MSESESLSKRKKLDPETNSVPSNEIEEYEEVVLEEFEGSEEENKSLSCGVCDKKFSTIEALNGHSKIEHFVIYRTDDTESEYGTIETGELTTIEATSVQFESDDNDDEAEICDICSKKFATETALHNHIKFEHSEADTNMYVDSQEIIVKEEPSYIVEEDEVLVDKEEDIEDTAEETIGCRICLKKFSTVAALNNHAMIDHIEVYNTGDSDAWTCELSELNEYYKKSRDRPTNPLQEGRDFLKKEDVLSAMAPETLTSTLANTNVHYVIMKHEGGEEMKKKKRNYVRICKKSGEQESPEHNCPECNRVYDTRSKMMDHIRYAHRTKTIVCELCGKKFLTTSFLKCHQRKHSGERPFLCNGCPRTFITLAQLKRHHFQHHQYKPHHCDVCEKRFCTPKELKEHRSFHITGKPHACDLCPMKYNQQQSLMIHYAFAHNEQRPHQCQTCAKSFDSLHTFKTHMSMNHPEESFYSCEQCSKKFNKEQALKAHVLSAHANNKLYTCKICSKTFNQLHSLQLHKQKVHQNPRKKSRNHKVTVEKTSEDNSDEANETIDD
ncbi:unnamed protein product [Chilo suppressalis]|uniref:C2H2-type domain-containing protein n=1 Tax=Chilo suppressalis TaxID=168631 RepID=A0ABN8B708_CHISP|nr:unnamed protein product [Chilo suppressalis]